MDEAFEKLKKEGHNSVDNLVKWIKDAKLIDEAKASEEKARKLFTDVADAKNVELAKFKEAVAKIAAEQKKSVEELNKMLSEEGSKLIGALAAGASAFKDAWNKK